MNIGGMNKGKLYRIREFLRIIKERKDTGCILEFGVWEGRSLVEIINFLRLYDMPNKVYGFDSFEGIPYSEPNGKNGQSWKKGEWSSTLENTAAKMAEELGHLNDVNFVPGIYREVLTDNMHETLSLNSAALIHIDCDLISSCNEVLAWCKPLLKVGTFLIFDEWDLGENESWELFQKENNNIVVRAYPYINTVKTDNHIIEIIEI